MTAPRGPATSTRSVLITVSEGGGGECVEPDLCGGALQGASRETRGGALSVGEDGGGAEKAFCFPAAP